MGKIVLGYWDCRYCDTTGITGDKRECPHCGHPRDEDVTFYMNPKRITNVDEEKAKNINKNPDWICPYCNCLNSDNNKICKSCGSVRTTENLDYHQNQERKKRAKQETLSSGNSYSSTSHASYDSDEFSYTTSNAASYQGTRTDHSSIEKVFFISLAIILGIIGIVYLMLPKTQTVTVSSLSWKYTIEIEELKTFQEDDWQLPAGARLKSSQTELHHYQDVLDHYETRTRSVAKQRISGYETYVSGYKDLGNGYFEEITSQRPIYETYYENETYQEPVYRKEPVYQTKYYYEIDRWVHARNVTTSGNDKNPYWGELTLDNKERVGNKFEYYQVTGTTPKGKSVSFAISKNDFNKIEVGKTYLFEINLGSWKLKQE